MLRYHFLPIRWQKVQKIDHILCDVTLGKQNLSFLYGGKAKWYNFYGG